MIPSPRSLQIHVGPLLGKGGFGEVYQGQSKTLGRVALKVLRTDADPKGQALQRLRDEFRALDALHHAHIPAVYDLVEIASHTALVTHFIDGIDLHRALRASTPLPRRAAVEALTQVADALCAAHQSVDPATGALLHLVHRDIKPANLRIDTQGRAWLLDFGIAWTDSTQREARTATAAIIGSPAYIAPERLLGEPPSAADDLFGLGCVLFEVLYGTRLLGGLALPALAALSADRTRFDAWVTDKLAQQTDLGLPELTTLLAHMLAHDPHTRPTAAEVHHRLATLGPQLPGQRLRTWARHAARHPPTPKDGPWSGQHLTAISLVYAQSDTQPSPTSRVLVLASSFCTGVGLAVGGAFLIGALPVTATAHLTADTSLPKTVQLTGASGTFTLPTHVPLGLYHVQIPTQTGTAQEVGTLQIHTPKPYLLHCESGQCSLSTVSP